MAELYCCVGTEENEQISIPFLSTIFSKHEKTTPVNTNGRTKSDNAQPHVLTTTAQNVERALEYQLDYKDSAVNKEGTGCDDDDNYDPVKTFLSDDAHLLKCRSRRANCSSDYNEYSILGIMENSPIFHEELNNKSIGSNDNSNFFYQEEENYEDFMKKPINVSLQVYQPNLMKNYDERKVSSQISGEKIEKMCWKKGCSCHHPIGDWKRRPRTAEGICEESFDSNFEADDFSIHSNVSANIKLIDMSALQLQRRRRSTEAGDLSSCRINSPGRVLHVLRSVLRCTSNENVFHGLHCASPWRESYDDNNNDTSSSIGRTLGISSRRRHCYHTDQVIAILLSNHISPGNEVINDTIDEDKWNALEKEEIKEFLKFRTGDASPSYYLYSASQLVGGLSSLASLLVRFSGPDGDQGRMIRYKSNNDSASTLLVYRHLTPRDQFTIHHPLKGPTMRFERRSLISKENGSDDFYGRSDGVLWETIKVPPLDGDASDEWTEVHRLVAPPYQSHSDIFPGLLNNFMTPENLKAVTDEALSIPKWTAWPERSHYQSAKGHDDKDDQEIYPDSWTVFPLCHTFPATDVHTRKFIEMTCAFVPRTRSLLQSLGPSLRTALFSRLDPNTRLEAHTGWADLANHVLRVHIPLVVPCGGTSEGLCGTWVDGCVVTQKFGHITCFDDSKVHRAFNYSEEERIVLIIDLARPGEGFPEGTAVGGHTDELDGFIQQFT